MKDFINRNKPVFIIAVVTIIVFVGIIVLAQNAPTTRPSLRKIENVELISKHTYTKGAQNPKVTLVEFSDFQCPACNAFNPIINQVYGKYKSEMKLAYVNFPLPQHPDAKLAAIAAQAAGAQDKFWEYGELLYTNQDNLQKEDLVKYAEEIGMNIEKFKKDLDSETYAKEVEEDIQLGLKVGINSTPTFILDNTVMEITTPTDFENQIAEAIRKAGGNTEPKVINNEPPKQTTTTTDGQDLKQIIPSKDVSVIEYTSDGFVPNNLKLKLGQRVKFVNTTDKEMTLRQLIRKYNFFNQPMKLAAGESYEFVLTEEDLWTFKEDSIRHYGSIFVSKE